MAVRLAEAIADPLSVATRPGAQMTCAPLIAYCQQHLAAYKVPREIQFVESVPMTPSGKIMRRMLKTIDDGNRSHQ